MEVNMKNNEGIYWIISEAALYFFLYYVQMLLNVQGNLWVSSLILGILINLAIVLCPIIRRCYKR